MTANKKTMPLPREKAWFAAKTYGWGWSLPLRWQGWIVLLVFLIGMFAGSLLLRSHLQLLITAQAFLCVALVSFCYWKGEATRWRWGKKE